MQIELLRELMKLQKDMIIMLLSMLEGNVLNGPSNLFKYLKIFFHIFLIL